MDVVIPKFPKNITKSTWDKFYRWAQNEQEADRVRHSTFLERVKATSDGIGEKAIEGVGECYAQMDSRMFHRQLQNDPHFFDDVGNIKKFFKDNPQYMNAGYKI